MRSFIVLVGLVAALGVVGLGGYAVAQDAPATPEVVQPATPEILPELCATPEGIGTPVDLDTGSPEDGAATPALFPCTTPEGSPAAADSLATTTQ